MKIKTIKEAWEFVSDQFKQTLQSGIEVQIQIPFNIIADVLKEMDWTYSIRMGQELNYSVYYKHNNCENYIIVGSLLTNEIMITKLPDV